MSERLYILDGNSLIYQVFHAIPEMTAPDGTPTNAVFGFVRDLFFLRRVRKPDYLVCAFDTPAATFRHALYPEYKANRAAVPDDLLPQFAVIREALDAFRIPVLETPGLEADDYLATVGVVAAKRGVHAYLCTADKDMRQVIGPLTTVFNMRKNQLIDAEVLRDLWGVAPEQVVDFQSLVGDSTDNIPGVRGIGEKTAATLLQKYGTLEGVYEHVDEVKGAKARQNLLEGRASAFMSRDLVRLKTDVPLPDDWSDWKPRAPNVSQLMNLFIRCGFHQFQNELLQENPPVETANASWDAKYVAVREPWEWDKFLAELKAQKSFSFDLETTALDPRSARIVGYALCWKPGEGYYLPVTGPEGEELLDYDKTLAALKPLLEDPAIGKLGQNLKYDLLVMRAHDVDVRGIVCDTMIASYLLEPGERSHNLDEQSRRLLGHETIKIDDLFEKTGRGRPEIRMEQVAIDRIAAYAGEDADVALRLAKVLEPRLEENGLAKLFREIELPLLDVLADMEWDGVKVDPARLSGLGVDFQKRLDELQTDAHRLAGKPFNLDSPVQLRTILFEELKLPVVKRTKSGPSTDQEVLEELAEEHDICAVIIEHRKLAKLKGTYLDNLPALISPKTGRIHASFNQTVAATGRLSSSDPNLQNIPVRTEEGRQIRQAFLPGGPGLALVSADYSQIELRMLAHFSQDPTLLAAFRDDLDIHSLVAAQISGVPAERVTEEQRRAAKTINFGVMYGLSPFGLARRLKISREDAAKFIDAYFDRYSAVETFFTRTLEAADQNRFVSTILGRRRPISGIKRTTGRVRNLAERTAINTVIQGS
ncbi:MAG TPA: DNA polymerase I, partial [Planctomycetia bacterium]|nr:DNA polymerase I [Planctomycetia bacterium]